MAQIRFFKGSALPNTITDGNIYVVPNNGKNTGDIYVDVNHSTRLQIKPDSIIEEKTTSQWATIENIITSEAGKIYIYSDKRINTPAIKIGDGTTYLANLPFYEVITADEKEFWNNKITAFMKTDLNGNETETLILSKE